MQKETIAIIAAVIAVIGNLPYLWDILRRRVQPHPYTWLVWTLVSATIFFGGMAKGAGVGAWPTGASEIFTVIIFLFSVLVVCVVVSKYLLLLFLIF